MIVPRSCDELASVESTLADPQGAPEECARALARLTIVALEAPWLIRPSHVSAFGRLLRAGVVAPEIYERALGLLAAVAYGRPDLTGDEAASGLSVLLGGPPLPATTYAAAGAVLKCLLTTPAAPRAIQVLLDSLFDPDRPPAVHEVVLRSLEYAAFWVVARLDLAALVALAERDHLAQHRDFLLHAVIERVLFADPTALTPELLDRLSGLYRGHPSWTYCLAYLASHRDVPAAARSLTAVAGGQFPLQATIRTRLALGERRVLMIQNIRDGQGDEIIRTVPLLQALLALNPLLEVVLVTKREYLYTHSRITLVPIDDPARTRAILREPYDVVIDFFEPVVPELNYDLELEGRIQAYVQAQRPFLYLSSLKGWNHFVYQRVDIDAQPYARPLRLDRQRVENIYETTFRMIAELGLPLRMGEAPPADDSVLAGLPCRAAESAWASLVERNTQRRLVALVCPFGGTEPLKGYIERNSHDLVEQLRGLFADGFYLVLVPNGMPWGSAEHARKVVSRLEPDEKQQVAVAPDPADGAGPVPYEHFGPHTVPYASYQMRLVSYFVRFADLVVTVEGWMMHAAYCLGKRYRVLMLPYSHPAEWHPYGRTRHQDVVQNCSPTARVPRPEADGNPPLPEQPRKLVLLSVLRSLGTAGDARALPVFRCALKSKDRDVRTAAAESLGRFCEAGVEADLLALLGDPANRVRAAAARALLERRTDAPSSLGGVPREQLLGHQRIGEQPRDWARVILETGDAARPALRIALKDDDPVVRREAGWALRCLESHRAATRPLQPVLARLRAGSALRRLPGLSAPRKPVLRAPRWLRPRGPADRGGGPTRRGGTVLILTPLKDAADYLETYCARLLSLTYRHALISLGFLESDSADGTFDALQRYLPILRGEFRRVGVWKRDFGYRLPPGLHRGAEPIQTGRRTVLAKSRNHLLFHALDEEDWVLWLDVDVIEYPPDLVERLLATGRDIVQPHCVLEYDGPTFDCNGWRDHGRLHLDDLREEGELVELDAVGGTVLLVRADVHRDGLTFPAFPYGRENPRVRKDRGELETEGLGIMARDLGYACWGMPHLEVIHARR